MMPRILRAAAAALLAAALPACGLIDAITEAIEAAEEQVFSQPLNELDEADAQGTERAFAQSFLPVFEAMGQAVEHAMDASEPASAPSLAAAQAPEPRTIPIDDGRALPSGGSMSVVGQIEVVPGDPVLTIVLELDLSWSDVPVEVGGLTYDSAGDGAVAGAVDIDTAQQDGDVRGEINVAGTWSLDGEGVGYSVTIAFDDETIAVDGTINGRHVEFDGEALAGGQSGDGDGGGDGDGDGEGDGDGGPPNGFPGFGPGTCPENPGRGLACVSDGAQSTMLELSELRREPGTMTFRFADLDDPGHIGLELTIPADQQPGPLGCDEDFRLHYDSDRGNHISVDDLPEDYCGIRLQQFNDEAGSPAEGVFTVLATHDDGGDPLYLQGSFDVTVP